MRISRGQLIAAAGAALLAGGVWLHNRNQTLKQLHGGIIETLQTKGRQDGSGDFVCTKDDMAIRTDGHSVRYQRPYPAIRPSSMDQAVKEPSPIIAIFHPITTSGIFNDQYAGPSEPLEVLEGMADTAGEFCINPTKSSPNNNPSSGQLLGFVTLGFFERQGNTIG